MHSTSLSYRIFSLGDAAITVDFGNTIQEAINNEVITRFREIQADPLPGMIEVIPAYSSLTIYFDVFKLIRTRSQEQTAFDIIKNELEKRLASPVLPNNNQGRLVKIPVCYDSEYGTDMQKLATAKDISVEDVMNIHTSAIYKVYMLGFLPGFAYMGEVDDRIAMPRKAQPVTVVAGSVGIAGKQTGIYPFASPGGWSIIGRTPLSLFDPNEAEPTLLKSGDSIQFYSISKDEFESY